MTHGDYSPMNVMFSHDEEGNPKCVKILDFQMMRPSSDGVFDILYYLHLCGDSNLRKNHEGEILRTYFEVLCKYHKPGSTGNFDEFMKSYEERRVYGLIGCSVS